MSKKQKKKTIKKPNPFLYYLACIVIAPFLKLRLHTSYDRSGIRNIKKPSIVVCPHVSNIDFLLVAMALFPHPTLHGQSQTPAAFTNDARNFQKNVLSRCKDHS